MSERTLRLATPGVASRALGLPERALAVPSATGSCLAAAGGNQGQNGT
jgi:hypothetical protein